MYWCRVPYPTRLLTQKPCIWHHPPYPVHGYKPRTSSNMPHRWTTFVPWLPVVKSQATSSSSGLRARPSRLSLAMSAADGDGGEGMGEDAEADTSSAVATKPKKKINSELDDLVGEMAGRAGDEPIVIPRGAGIAPMSPGPIKADPIPGMDGEVLQRVERVQ